LVVLTSSPVAFARNGGSDDPIEGLWNVEVTIEVCNGPTLVTFDALALFAHGGTFHDTNANDPKLRSSAFGTWKRVRSREYEFAFKAFLFDGMGANTGWQIIRHRVTLLPGGNRYVSLGGAEVFDPDGELVMTGCSRSTATRFE
jgi:hypothetical protein